MPPSWHKENVVENRSEGRKREEVPRKVTPPRKATVMGRKVAEAWEAAKATTPVRVKVGRI